jgi:hypothetical protein
MQGQLQFSNATLRVPALSCMWPATGVTSEVRASPRSTGFLTPRPHYRRSTSTYFGCCNAACRIEALPAHRRSVSRETPKNGTTNDTSRRN